MTQIPMFQPLVEWAPPPVSSLPSWAEARRVAIDIETYDPLIKKYGPGVRRGGRVIGVSFAIEDGPSYYLPFGHPEDNLPADKVWGYLRDQADKFKGILVGANMQYDLDYLAENGVWFGRAKWFRDVQIAEPLIDELQMSYSLQAISERHGLPGKDEKALREAAEAWKIDPKKEMYKLPARFVADYAKWDAELPLKLLRRQERIIDEQNLWGIYDLESKVLPVLVKMRRRGVKIDFDRLQKVEDWARGEADKCLKVVKEETNKTIVWDDLWKAKAIAPALTSIGVVLEKTKTGLPSVHKDLLASIDHPVAKALERARQMNKVVTTFVKSIREHQTGGRIHCSFNQLRTTKDEDKGEDKGARYGRLSSTDPNMQQQPARHPEIGPLWRAIYAPDDGKIWAALDYSQQEPRWLVHFAEATLGNFFRAGEAAQKYRDDPDADNHQMMADMCGIKRKEAKELFLGKIYGMGPAKLCHKLGLPTKWVFSKRAGQMREVAGPEGDAVIQQFAQQLPFVDEISRVASQVASERGYILTVLGRRCRFPITKDERGRDVFDWCHKALNRLIQGSSADQTKVAMVQLDSNGFEPQLQVHDEVDCSVETPKQAQDMAEIMMTCVPARVPFRVDVELGPSWGEAIDIEKYLEKFA